MKDELVTYITARIAQQKGFNEPCIDVYKDGILYERYEIDTMDEMTIEELRHAFEQTNSQCDTGTVTAPTQSLLQKWLRDVHGMYIVLDMTSYSNDWRWQLCRRDTQPIYSQVLDQTYEEALEGGLIAGLSYLPQILP